jgi:UTP--glucose-1-phosphate uridylyltransferase
MKIRKAIIPVAGLGTRLLPASKVVPKELLPILDKPVLQILVQEAVEAGITEIIFVINSAKTAIKKYFSTQSKLEDTLKKTGKLKILKEIKAIQNLAKFKFCLQHEPLGDGHAILQARKLIGSEPFLVLFGDEVFIGDNPCHQLIQTFTKKKSATIALTKVKFSEVENYGIISPKSRYKNIIEIADFVEKPKSNQAPSNFAITGKYVLPPEIFSILEKKPSSSGEIRLIDALIELKKIQPIFGKILTGKRFDTGNKFGLLTANLEFALQDPEIKKQVKQYLRKILN